ncbi:MAG: DNA methyltransferase [candidate division WOR-3 bacterium]
MKRKMIVLAKLKFDLRASDEVYLAEHEISSILNCDVYPVKTIPALFKRYPFNRLSDEAIHIITRNLYLGGIQGYMAEVEEVDIQSLISKPAFFREIFLIFEDYKSEEEIKNILSLNNENLSQIFTHKLENGLNLFLIRLLTSHTLFEYVSDVLKLPSVAITPKNRKSWDDYFKEKEEGIKRGLNDLLYHLKSNHYRAPHFGLGKRHIGDFVDWATTDLRKPFLHYLHKYKGKGDPRISRALINLLKVNKGDTILDPFVGSGAFIADAAIMGINAIGIEILEIGKIIAEVKCSLDYDIKILRDEILKLFSNAQNIGVGDLFSPNCGDEILSVKARLKEVGSEKIYQNIIKHLQQIICLKRMIDEIKDIKVKKLLLVLLSQKIVEFAEKKQNVNFISSFLSYVENRYLMLYATQRLAEMLEVNLTEGSVRIIKADSTDMSFIPDNSLDGILTSPPYFDALDYVDNNKASIIVLGLDDDLKIGSTKDYFSKFRNYNINLPESSRELIGLLQKSRRSTKAEIVENYLNMMKLSFGECYRVLKPGKFYVMVVSKYHSWIINGKEEIIETAKVLVDLGISAGFKVSQLIEHGLSKADKGKIGVEEIIVFEK